MKQNIVVFKGRKDGITILMDDKVNFEDIKAMLSSKVIDARKFFGGAKTSILFQGRNLNETEEGELLAIIAQKANLDISFVTNEIYKGIQMPPTGKKSSNLITPDVASFGQKKIFLPEHITKFQTGSMRSGQEIRFSGSVVVLGDVNPGAEIIVEGNIIILGALKGLVHAGCTGNKDCFVFATSMNPTQLRIANIITCLPELKKSKKKVQAPVASYAYIEDGQIYIAPLVDF